MASLKGLATGIGSLPYCEAAQALELIFKHTPRAPFWPQLPRRDAREGMVAQFAQNLPCLKIKDDGGVFYDPSDCDAELEKFYERVIAQDSGYFQITEDLAPGIYAYRRRLRQENIAEVEFLKGHITGPFTFAAAVTDESGSALLHNDIMMQVIIKGLVLKACWQVEFLKEFGKKTIIFVDEPYLGCFGSAYTPITRESAVAVLNDLCSGIKSAGALVGIHCCGNTDWSILTDVSGVDIISFDAFNYMDRLALYADDLRSFIDRGGMLCWGVVPTREFTGTESAQDMLLKITAGLDLLVRKGLERKKLLDKLIISPSCGLGSLDAAKAAGIFNLLSLTSQELALL